MSTMVALHIAETGRVEHVAPDTIARVAPWIVLEPECLRTYGARVTLADSDDTELLVAEDVNEVLLRIDVARAALCNMEHPEQPVRVTNWMAQFWVLLVANFFVAAFTYRWGEAFGHFVRLTTGLDPYWWLP